MKSWIHINEILFYAILNLRLLEYKLFEIRRVKLSINMLSPSSLGPLLGLEPTAIQISTLQDYAAWSAGVQSLLRVWSCIRSFTQRTSSPPKSASTIRFRPTRLSCSKDILWRKKNKWDWFNTSPGVLPPALYIKM